MALSPFAIPGKAGRLPRYNFDDYSNCYWAGPNITESLESWSFRAELWGEPGSIVRLPRTVRIITNFETGTPADSWNDHYVPVFEQLSEILRGHRVCTVWGTSNEFSVLDMRWLRYASPDAPENFPSPDDIIVGPTLQYIFTSGNLGYGTLAADYTPPLAATAENYRDDREMFISRHPRMQRFTGIVYNKPAASDPEVGVDRMIAGTDAFAQFGQGLGIFGWGERLVDWDTDLVPLETFVSDCRSFFNFQT
jgi:hypothetical protein